PPTHVHPIPVDPHLPAVSSCLPPRPSRDALVCGQHAPRRSTAALLRQESECGPTAYSASTGLASPAVQAWLHEGFGASGLFKHPARFGKALVADSAGLRHAASSPAGKS